MEFQIVPQFIGQRDMVAKNTFSSLIVQNQTLGDMFEAAGGSKLGTIGAAVNHEGGTPAGLAAFCSQVSDNSSGRKLTDVVESQFNWHGTKQVIEKDSVADKSTSRLEQDMNMLNVI